MFFFVRGGILMERQLKEKLRTTAAVAAMQFNPATIRSLEGVPPEQVVTLRGYRDVVDRLNHIRAEVPAIRYAYIMRRTANPAIVEFAADADSLATDEELDANGNGVVDENEEASYPGDPYDITDVPALQGPAFEGPAVDDDFTVDQWGTLITGYAPIRDAAGNTLAVLGLDMNAQDYMALTRSIFSPVAFLLLCLGGLLLAAFVGGFLWRRRAESLRRIDRERSALLLLAMHQIGSPLTIIRWSLEQLMEQKGTGSLEKAVEEFGTNVRDASAQLSAILDELHEASEVDAGTLVYTREWASIGEVVAGVVNKAEPQLKDRGQTIDLKVDSSLHISLDRTLIAGVLRELLQNAMTFSPRGSTITVAARRGGKCLLVEVIDRGCGIPKSDMPRLFGKFSRGSKAHLHQPNGSGLGLYIAKGVVDHAGGDLWIRSEEGKGTTVSFTLPC